MAGRIHVKVGHAFLLGDILRGSYGFLAHHELDWMTQRYIIIFFFATDLIEFHVDYFMLFFWFIFENTIKGVLRTTIDAIAVIGIDYRKTSH